MTQAIPSKEPSPFDLIIEKIGNAGPYQKRFNFIFIFFLTMVAVMPHTNLVVSLAIPDHWCHVPGRENTTYSIEEWKNRNIPRENDSRNLVSYSKCKRYVNPSIDNLNLTKCDKGWEYDHTWYDRTAPMQNNWVCDDVIVSSNALAVGRIGEVIGTLIFGQLADTYGRKPIFFISVVTLIVGRVMATVTSASVHAFIIFSVISSLPGVSIFHSPLVIAIEISRPEDRAWISMLQCMGWNAGLVLMPLIMWWLRDWVSFFLVSTLPCGVFLFSSSWMIESPRWLASKGKIQRSCKELEIVAKTNKTEIPSNTEVVLKKAFYIKGDKKLVAILAVFSSPRLAKNTILLIVCLTILMMIYTCLMINVSNLDGNPFLNYLFQALAEIPSYLVGMYASDRYGRRWTSMASFVLTFLACIFIMLVLENVSAVIVISALSAFMKFSVSIAFYSITLQTVEIYPTCVRQTGTSVGMIVGSCFGILFPYIVALGTSVNAKLPYIIYAAGALLATVCCLFLPETHGHLLPESLADASKFGADQNIWGKSKSPKTSDNNGVEVPLRSPVERTTRRQNRPV